MSIRYRRGPSADGKPGRPSTQQSAAATTSPPAPSRLPDPRQYSPWNASSGAVPVVLEVTACTSSAFRSKIFSSLRHRPVRGVRHPVQFDVWTARIACRDAAEYGVRFRNAGQPAAVFGST